MIKKRKEKYKIIIRKKALKNLHKIPVPWKIKISKAIELLESDPFYGEKLWGEFADCRKVRIWPYRLIYKISEREKIVYITYIEHRQGVYK